MTRAVRERGAALKIAAYIVVKDGGFSPNPFHGWLTLACCKPAIRRTAKRGDWIVGITPHALGNRLAFVMEVAETPTYEEYWSDSRFRAKRPRWSARNPLAVRRGDNCYKPLGHGRFEQLPCCHWDDVRKREHPRAKARDLGGERVLVARRFSYYGANAKPIPERLRFMVPGRGHRSKFTPDQKAALLAFLQKLPSGVHGKPRHWPEGDDTSWKDQGAHCG